MPRITVCTAYTTNYTLGRLCEDVNRRYCQRHGYRFVSEALDAKQMQAAIDPRTSFSWFKVLMLNRLLEEEIALKDQKEGYVLWIDADAVFVREDRKIESIISMGPDMDLIVGEDLSAACQINAGVLLVRVSRWSQALFRDMWNRKSRFQRARYFEQSELLKQLSFRNEGLEMVEPFHSYRKGPLVKRFPHVLVLPREEFNSNRGVALPTTHGGSRDNEFVASKGEQDIAREKELRVSKEAEGSEAEEKSAGGPVQTARDDCRFIFHAVGSWNKWPVVCAMLKQCDVELPAIAGEVDAKNWLVPVPAHGYSESTQGWQANETETDERISEAQAEDADANAAGAPK